MYSVLTTDGFYLTMSRSYSIFIHTLMERSQNLTNHRNWLIHQNINPYRFPEDIVHAAGGWIVRMRRWKIKGLGTVLTSGIVVSSYGYLEVISQALVKLLLATLYSCRTFEIQISTD